MKSRSAKTIAWSWCCCWWIAAASAARADFHNNPLLPVGEVAGLMGGAAAASVDDGSSSWYNPAGLGAVREQGISASLSAYGFQHVAVPAFADYGGGRKGGLSSTVLATFPSYLGYVHPFGGPRFRHALGIAVVVPDFERVDGSVDIPGGGPTPWELNARLKHLSQTVWGLPAWGGCWAERRLCIGAALGLGYRTQTTTWMNAFRTVGLLGSLESSLTYHEDLWMAMLAPQVGLQWQLAGPLRLGASVRSPVFTLAGGGSVLQIDSNVQAAVQQVRRVEDPDVTVEYRLPLQARAGLSLDVGRFRFAADVVVSPPQSSFPFVRGRDGETHLQPVDLMGMPAGAPVEIGQDLERPALVDVAAGVSVRLGERWALLGGVFTLESGAEKLPEADVFGDRVGATLGFNRRGRSSTTRAGITVVAGHGQVGSFAVDGGAVDSRSYSAYLNLGGTTDF